MTHRGKEIRCRHQAAKDSIDLENVHNDENSSNQWLVPSRTTQGKVYPVHRLCTRDECQCRLVCNMCSVCQHMFRFECVDYEIRGIACKHMHAVQMKLNLIWERCPKTVFCGRRRIKLAVADATIVYNDGEIRGWKSLSRWGSRQATTPQTVSRTLTLGDWQKPEPIILQPTRTANTDDNVQ